MKEQEIMNLGIDEARITMLQNIGGPFGAVIADKDQSLTNTHEQARGVV